MDLCRVFTADVAFPLFFLAIQALPPELLRKCNLHEDAPPGICPFTPREQVGERWSERCSTAFNTFLATALSRLRRFVGVVPRFVAGAGAASVACYCYLLSSSCEHFATVTIPHRQYRGKKHMSVACDITCCLLKNLSVLISTVVDLRVGHCRHCFRFSFFFAPPWETLCRVYRTISYATAFILAVNLAATYCHAFVCVCCTPPPVGS